MVANITSLSTRVCWLAEANFSCSVQWMKCFPTGRRNRNSSLTTVSCSWVRITAILTWKSEGRTFNVHRNILGIRSKVFKAMFYSMLEEAKRGYVEIEDTDADTVEEMLGYMYAGRLPASGMKSAERLLIAADKYDLEELKEICENQLSIEITERNACEKLMLADMYKCSTLKRRSIGFHTPPYWWHYHYRRIQRNVQQSISCRPSERYYLWTFEIGQHQDNKSESNFINRHVLKYNMLIHMLINHSIHMSSHILIHILIHMLIRIYTNLCFKT